ncbi:MAG: LPS export ABC transporter periplasmic protein LptC [Gammaproteobacteria bacterium]|nr:LPS export ABC transporter periplasmic protein LptC [Gammaproteobacteria bacterium]
MKRLISFSIFFVVAIVAWWSTSNDLYDDNQLQQFTDKPYIEIFMNKFELTAMNDSGKPGYTLQGLELIKYNDSDDTIIQQPVIHLLQKSGQWTITAENAVLNNSNKTIQLNDHVIMQQQNRELASTIRTQSLLIHTQKQIAQTSALVEITRGKSLIRSTGMTYNNLTSELELSSKVSSHYLPNE